jgi:predicted enzyme related to lactoylglutathione lyase
MQNAINWFEIPVADLARATAFYADVLQIELRTERFQDTTMAIFPYGAANHGVGGALVQDARKRPAPTGATVYLNAGSDIRGAVARAANGGGQVTMPVTDIGVPGFIALIQDTEGNVVGLHEPRLPQSA